MNSRRWGASHTCPASRQAPGNLGKHRGARGVLPPESPQVCPDFLKSGTHPRRWLLLFIILLGVLAALPVMAQENPTELMLAANRHYEAGQFEQAIQGYQAVAAAGIHNSDVYYNLGNAYFKQNELGRAILNYRRAQHLDPRDGDIANNLALARAQTIDRLTVDNQGLMVNFVQVAEQWLTLNEAAILALGLWALICLLAVGAILMPRLRSWLGWAMVVLALFLAVGLLSMANRLYTQYRYPPVVVVAEEVDVTSGPGAADQYLVEFTLHSGAEARLLESRPEWRRITLAEDLQGWVPARSVELVLH